MSGQRADSGDQMRRAILWLVGTALIFTLPFGVWGCGHKTITGPEPVTAAQIVAHDSSYEFAERKGVRLDAVWFMAAPPPPCNTCREAEAWTPCGLNVVAFNVRAIEHVTLTKVRQDAAHEVAHLFYGDQMHCGLSKDQAEMVEVRAEACANFMLQGTPDLCPNI